MDSSNEPAATKEPVEDAYAPAEGYEERREHAKRSNVAEFDDVKADQRDTTEYDVDPNELGSTAATATGAAAVSNAASSKPQDDSTTHNTVRTGKEHSTLDHADPYWGDLPQGQGTYNTVAGHGSTSDEARRHHSGDDTSGQRTFPLVTDRTRQHHQDPAERRFEDQHQESQHQEQQKDSHWKEGTAGAAGAGAAGTAAYLATRDHEDRSKNEPEETEEEKEKKKKSGGLFGIFHRDHKDKDTHKDEKKEEKKLTKEEKVAPVAAAGYASRDDKRHDEKTQGDNLRSTRDPAVAAAAMAYSTHGNDGTSTSRRDDPTTRGNNDGYNHLGDGTPSGVRTGGSDSATARDPVTSSHTGDHKDSNRNAALYGTAGTAAALGAGGYAAHESRKDRDEKKAEPLTQNTATTTTTTTTTSRGNDDGYNHLADGTPSGVRTGGSDSATSREPVTSSQTGDHKSSNRDAALYGTAGTAAALGAGGYAAHEMRNDRADKKDLSKDTTTTRSEAPRSGGWFTSPATNTTQSTDPAQSQRDTFSQEDSSRRANPGFAAAPVAASSLSRDPAADTYPSASTATTGTSQPAMREPSSEIPRTTEIANEGKYNTLSSGTPSGINIGGTDDKTKSAGTTLPTVQDEKSNRGAMATAGIAAAGAGAGGAYYATRDDDKKDDKPLQKDTKTTTSSALPGTVGGQEKVTHKCVKCGEENDITQLIKEKTRGH